MDKKQLVEKISKRMSIDATKADTAIDSVIADIVSPYVLNPGETVGFINDNNCRNNCKELDAAVNPAVRAGK